MGPSRRRKTTGFEYLLALALFGCVACDADESRQTKDARPSPVETTQPLAKAAAAGVGKYGAPLAGAPSAPLAAVLAKPAEYAGRDVRVEGHLRRVCSAMGCWMELAESPAADAPACRVIMKNHSFFVPTDSAGSSARVEGSLDVRRIEPAQVAHMESEGAQFPNKAPDGSAEEVRFVAKGVELWRGS